jgi:AraC-like DNA-binding protein
MTLYPFDLTDYPGINGDFPFTIGIHKVERFPPHRHDFLEISLVIEGRGEETVNGEVHAMMPGALTLVLPYQVHELRAYPGTPMRMYNCMFSAELLSASSGLLDHLKERLLGGEDNRASFMQLEQDEAVPIDRIFGEMLDECDLRRDYCNAFLKAKVMELMIRIDRLRTGRADKGDEGSREKDIPDRIWRVIRHMHSHYKESLSLTGLAEIFHFNRTYLSEQIKKHTGKNFVDLLHEIRLRQACSLLVSSDMTVSGVAYEVGYGSAKTLFAAFLKYRGTTPGEFRNRSLLK